MDDELFFCHACGEANPRRAKFCLECGTRLRDDAADGSASAVGERRLVTVLFADLSGFTSFSERADPEDVRALAAEAAVGLGEIVERYGGIVDKIIGDCVMAVFGAPVTHEDDPERAVRAALDMQAYVTEHRDRFARLPLRIGVNTGEAIFAPVGRDGRYTVLGDTVNTCARLQSGAARGAILVGEATYRSTAATIEFEDVEPITAKGKERPIPAWRAVSMKGVTRRPGRSRVPLIGREAELNRLRELWERARNERTRFLAVVLGDPGIGKSRLVEEVTTGIGDRAAVYSGRCLSYGEGITYWPIIEVLKEAAGIVHGDDPDAVSRKLGELLEGLGSDDTDELRTMAAALANLLAVPVTPRGTYRSTSISKAELHWGVRRVLELSAARRPTIIVLDDLHWAEPTLLELIEFLMQGEALGQLLIVAAGRPELRDIAPEPMLRHPAARVIALRALREKESEALVVELAGVPHIPRGPVGEVLRRAAGNPLFLAETVRDLREQGILRPDGSLGEGAMAALSVPDSLRSLIDSRIDRLPGGARQVLHLASVMGSVFWPGALAYLDADAAGNERCLEILEERDLIERRDASSIGGEVEYAFKHLLLRDVAYDGLPKSRRAELHARFGEWMSSLSQGSELVEIVAYHLEQACMLAAEVARARVERPVLPAVGALRRAAERALSREGMREAERFFARALAVVGDAFPETALDLRLSRSKAQAVMGQLEEATARLREVADEADELGRPDLRCLALIGVASIDQALARVGDARRALETARDAARQVGEEKLEIRAAFELASLRADYAGEVAEGVADLKAGLAAAERIGDCALQLEGLLRLGTLLSNSGALAEAEEQFARCRELAAEEGTLRWQANATRFLASIRYLRGPRQEAERLAREADMWLERTADRYTQLQNLRTLAKLALARGDLDAAERRLRRALPLALRFGGWLAVDIDRWLVETLVRAGRIDEAAEAAARARQNLAEEDPYCRAAVLIADAFVALGSGDTSRFRDLFAQALPSLGDESLAVDLAEARLTFGLTLARAGRPDQAEEQLSLAREMFASMGAAAMVGEVDAALVDTGERAG